MSKHTMGKKNLQQMLLGKMNFHMQKNEMRAVFIALHNN